jgi:hypothetical protein
MDDGVAQENNGVENLLKRLKIEESWLETCGPSSLEAIFDFFGQDMSFLGPCQPSDVFTMLMHDYRYSPLDKPLPMNRYLSSYPGLIEKLFPAFAGEVVEYTDDKATMIRKDLSEGPIMIDLINPGHFIACKSIDSADVVTYNESWMHDTWNPGTTRIRTIALADLVQNVKEGYLKVRRK